MELLPVDTKNKLPTKASGCIYFLFAQQVVNTSLVSTYYTRQNHFKCHHLCGSNSQSKMFFSSRDHFISSTASCKTKQNYISVAEINEIEPTNK